MLGLSENESEDYLDTYKKSKSKRKHHDSDEEYNVKEDEDLYSDIDEDDDISFLMNKTVKKKKPKIIKNKENIQRDKPIRISLKKSLGRNNQNLFKKRVKLNASNDINTPLKSIENTNTKPKLPTSNKIIKNNKEEKRIFQNNLELNQNLDKTYFYQNVTPTQWKEITNFISESLFSDNLPKEKIAEFFENYPNLSKGENNLKKLRQILNDSVNNKGIFSFLSTKKFNFESYQKINDYIIDKFYMAKPTVFEVHFFPNPSEEIHLINLISKAKTSLDIAMFTINNVKIASEIKNIFSRGVKLRILSDSECIKMPSSNVYSLAATGISVKIDDSVRYHMHHKFCVIDKSVVITGSFNWTDQAVNHNQENLLFIENKELALKYSNEFEKLWNDFEIVVTKEKAEMKIKEDEEKKRAAESRKQREKEKKIAEKENMKKVYEEITEKKNEMKTFSKKKRRRPRGNDENVSPNLHSQKNNANCTIF